MRRAHPRAGHLHTGVVQPVGQPVRQHAQPLDNRLAAPCRHLLHAERRHFQRNEKIPLAHVEPPRAIGVTQVAQIWRGLGIHRAPRRPRLLQRRAVLSPFRHVEERPAIRPKHPLVSWKHHEIRIERPHVQCHHPSRMRRIDQQRRTLAPQRRANAFQIDRTPIRPMHRGDRRQPHRRRARPVDFLQQRRGPVAVGRLPHGLHDELRARRARPPFQHRRDVVVLQRQHPRAARRSEQFPRGGDAVADRGDQRHVLRAGIDQPGRRATGTLELRRREIGGQRPGLALAGHRRATRVHRGARQRAPGGGVQVADLAGNIEQVALRRQHRREFSFSRSAPASAAGAAAPSGRCGAPG